MKLEGEIAQIKKISSEISSQLAKRGLMPQFKKF
jgi:hypothetical protein